MTRYRWPRRASYPTLARVTPGVVMPLGLEGCGQHVAHLSAANTFRLVTCSVPPPRDLHGAIWRGHVLLRELPDGSLAVETVRRDDGLDPLTLVAPHACRLPGVVEAFLGFLASITTEALRRFLSDVFAQSSVFAAFWSAPAAPDHHRWRGGLACHTLEVLEILDRKLAHAPDNGAAWPPVERDLAIVAAWLHDIAECVDHGAPSSAENEARRCACAMRRPDLVGSAIDSLHASDQPLAAALLALWGLGEPAKSRHLRVDGLRQLLLASHRTSEASAIRPMPDHEAVVADRIMGVTAH